MRYHDHTATVSDTRAPAAWILAYATVDVPLAEGLRAMTQRHPDVPVFGCTSFRGVFSPGGFTRGLHALAADPADGVRASGALRAVGTANARAEARSAAAEIRASLDAPLNCLLLHATPGFEERVLEGIDEAFEGRPPPVYGGSAADDDIRGDWKVFLGTSIVREGFVLAGFSTKKHVFGSFVAGYAPTNTHGVVTAARGRIVETIDGRPAATVYNEWTHGIIQSQMGGGGVLPLTTLWPLGRVVDKVGAVPRYVLSHPHEVLSHGALALFTDVKVGDELVLMFGTESALLERTNQVANRALASGNPDEPLGGGILVYCGGCVGALGAKVPDVAVTFRRQLHDAPFVGAATFGEQGCFAGHQAVNRHGNLMCDAIMFEA
jgi:hypothetical protein